MNRPYDYVNTFVSISETARDVWTGMREFILPDLDEDLTPDQANLLLWIHNDETAFGLILAKAGKFAEVDGIRVGDIVDRVTRTQTLANYHLANLWKHGWIALLPMEGGAPIIIDTSSAGRRKNRGFRLRDRVSVTKDKRRRRQLDWAYERYEAFGEYLLRGCDLKDLEGHRRVNRYLITEFGGGGAERGYSTSRASKGDSHGFASASIGTLMVLQQANSDLERKPGRRSLEGTGLSLLEADLLTWLKVALLTDDKHVNARRLLDPDEKGFVTLRRLVNCSTHLPKNDPVLVTRLLTRMMGKSDSLVQVEDKSGVPKAKRFAMGDRLRLTEAGCAKAEMVMQNYAEAAERVLDLYIKTQTGGEGDLEAHLCVNKHIQWLLRPAFLQMDAGKNLFVEEAAVEPKARLNCLGHSKP